MQTINRWILYTSDGHPVRIWDDFNWIYGVDISSSTHDLERVNLCHLGNGYITFQADNGDNSFILANPGLQFQKADTSWNKRLKDAAIFKFILVERGFFVLQAVGGGYVQVGWPPIYNTIGPLVVMQQDISKAARFYAVGVDHLSTLDFITMGYKASDLVAMGYSFSNQKFGQSNLACMDFTGIDLSKSDLTQVSSFGGCILDEARLINTTIGGRQERLTLQRTSLSHTDFTGADLSNCDLTLAAGIPFGDQAQEPTTASDSGYSTLFAPKGTAAGIGKYSLLGLSVDLGFAFDYNGSGTPDHLVFYSPGNQLSSITKVASDGTLLEVYSSNQGIGGYDLKVSVDLGFAFDYDGFGKLDHLLFYRPSGDDGASGGSIFIMKNNRDGTFTNRYADRGIGGFDIRDTRDRGFAFDYDGSGATDHLVFYRPGESLIYFIQHDAASGFSTTCSFSDGIGSVGSKFDLKMDNDLGFAFDYDGSGKLDHLVFYRPGSSAIWIIKNNRDKTFSTLFSSSSGIAGFALYTHLDRGFAFDYTGSGRPDHLVFYSPGLSKISIIRNNRDGTFTDVYSSSSGIGGYDLLNEADLGFACDYFGGGKANNLAFYRPAAKTLFLLEKDRPNPPSNILPTFTQTNLSNSILQGINLSNVNMLGAKLIGATLNLHSNNSAEWTNMKLGDMALGLGADLTGVKLSNCYIWNSDFSKVVFEGAADLTDTSFNTCTLQEAKFQGAIVHGGAWYDLDLTGADLTGIDFLSLIDFSNLSFKEAILTDAILTYRDLTQFSFQGATLIRTHLDSTKLEGTDFTGAKLSCATFSNAKFSEWLLKGYSTILTDANLEGTIFDNTDLTHTVFSAPIIQSTDPTHRTSFVNATLPYSVIGLNWSCLDLTGATVIGLPTDLAGLNAYGLKWISAPLKGCILNGADFSNAVLDDADFVKAKLKKHNKVGVKFNSAHLVGAQMTYADFDGTDFTGSILGDQDKSIAAKFIKSYFNSCTFCGANLNGVDFTWATLIEAKFQGTATTLQKASFFGAYLPLADFTDADLEGISMTFAFLADANLTNANLAPANDESEASPLEGAVLFGVNWQGTQLQGANLTGAYLSQQEGSLPVRYYDELGNLFPPSGPAIDYKWDAQPYPDPKKSFSNDTSCPNGDTYSHNVSKNIPFEQMMTATKTLTVWYPPESLPSHKPEIDQRYGSDTDEASA